MSMRPRRLSTLLAVAALSAAPDATADGALRRTALKSAKPDDEIVRTDLDQDGRPDLLERWWNGKRARWLDEGGTLRADDTRGDTVNGLLQLDLDGDGVYDSDGDANVRWCDTNRDGVPDVQAYVAHAKARGGAHWMLFLNHDRRGVLGWMDWQTFDFACWGRTGTCNWLPNYHGNGDFLKIHRTPESLDDPRLNWENPFSFFDCDGDGLSEMAMRWHDPYKVDGDRTALSGRYSEAFLTFDIDNDTARGNETAYDLTLRGAGGPGFDYTHLIQPLPGFKGHAKFDPCFRWNAWRQIGEVKYIPQAKQYETFFATPWSQMYFVFDEDRDDHRWERVELYYPSAGLATNAGPVDLYSTQRWPKRKVGGTTNEPPPGRPGLAGHPQADSLGDRGEFDADNSGTGRLYVGRFDRKLHLFGAEWGAWTVDRGARFHGGAAAPSTNPAAERVEELVKYSDTDRNGFLDTIEFDYDGDRNVDLKVELLACATADDPHPDVAPLLDTKTLGWRGLHESFQQTAEASWQEALQTYRAAWRRGLTTAELDRRVQASSLSERQHQAYWIKEEVFRLIRARLAKVRQADASTAARWTDLENALTRAYYTARFDDYAGLIGQVPGE
jgi:hypothetical protein